MPRARRGAQEMHSGDEKEITRLPDGFSYKYQHANVVVTHNMPEKTLITMG